MGERRGRETWTRTAPSVTCHVMMADRSRRRGCGELEKNKKEIKERLVDGDTRLQVRVKGYKTPRFGYVHLRISVERTLSSKWKSTHRDCGRSRCLNQRGTEKNLGKQSQEEERGARERSKKGEEKKRGYECRRGRRLPNEIMEPFLRPQSPVIVYNRRFRDPRADKHDWQRRKMGWAIYTTWVDDRLLPCREYECRL